MHRVTALESATGANLWACWPSGVAMPLTLALTALLPTGAAGVTIGEQGDVSVGLFMRIQPRMELERIRPASGAEWRRDFLIRRSRIWLQGKVHGADYKLQWKIDN